jgi:hypothetical protein
VGAASDFRPTQLAGCVLWLRSDLGITLNGSTVSAWADQSGNGNNATQGTGANQPTYSASDAGYAGRPSLSFDGTDDSMSSALAVNQPDTVVVVANGTNGAQAELFDVDSGANRQAVIDSNGLQVFAGVTLAPGGNLNTKAVIAAQFHSTTSAFFRNNSQTAVASGDAGTNNMGNLCICGYQHASNFWTGKVVEFLVYNRILAPSEMSQLFAYLGARYGIAVS